VGAANLAGDGGYADKVMAEYARLHRVATGKPLPAQPPVVQPPASPPPAADGADLRAANSATTPSVVAKLAS
jgi:hypothetical protein